jgi:hypothetical protein
MLERRRVRRHLAHNQLLQRALRVGHALVLKQLRGVLKDQVRVVSAPARRLYLRGSVSQLLPRSALQPQSVVHIYGFLGVREHGVSIADHLVHGSDAARGRAGGERRRHCNVENLRTLSYVCFPAHSRRAKTLAEDSTRTHLSRS